MAYLFASPVMATALILQAAEGGGGIPWWVWFILIAVLLLLLLIGFARQPEPGQPLPKPEERVVPVAAAVALESDEEEALDTLIVAGETADEHLAQKPEVDDSESTVPAAEASKAEPAPADDLKRIEGIGPKIAGIFDDNDITTFAALAASEPEQLQEILDTAGIRLAHPGTWPEQATLAAAGQWDELEKLQDGMKGDRQK